MTLPKLDFLTPSELAQIGGDVAALLVEPQVSVALTYRRYTGQTFTPSTGANTPTYTDTALRAVRVDVSAREVAAAGGLYRQGDVRFLVPRVVVAGVVALPIEPAKDDRLVVDGATYDLVDWASDQLGLTWRLVARGVA